MTKSSPSDGRRREPLMDHPVIAGTLETETRHHPTPSCCRAYWYDCVWPGLGLFGESYLLFSIGTLQPLWDVVSPACFVAHETCRPEVLRAVPYGTVAGIILGMILIGPSAQVIGRRYGSILTATLMTVGAIGLTCTALWVSMVMDGDVSESTVWSLTTSLFIFGIGVGGEYPLAASSASEKDMTAVTDRSPQQRQQQQQPSSLKPPPLLNDNAPTLSQQQHQNRGKHIQLVFSMQGMGIFCNSIVLTSLLVLYGQTGTGQNEGDYDAASLLQIWQIVYAFGLSVLVFVLFSRYRYLKESVAWKRDKEQRDQQQQQRRLPEHTITSTAPSNHHDASSITAPGVTTTINQQHGDIATDFASASVTPDIPMTTSDVSDLSTPSLAVMEFEADNAGGPFLALREELTEADLTEDARLSTWALSWKHYGVRLVGVSLCWFLWDVAFYGNKLFQSSFLLALTGGRGDANDDVDDAPPTSLIAFSTAAALNAGVALMGYIGAAFLVDHPSIGRRQLQQWGFCLTGILFLSCGVFYHSLSSATLVTMYLGSSFFGQLGPNATTFALPAEIFPTQIRTTCHGVAAAAGKLGALAAAVCFPMVRSDPDLFLLSGYASLVAGIVTFYTIPETSGLDLSEMDRKWHSIRQGKRNEYHGSANHPRFLSYYERQRWSSNDHRHRQQYVQTDDHYDHAMDDY